MTFKTSVCTHIHARVRSGVSTGEYNTCVSVCVHLNPCITYARCCLQCSGVLSMRALFYVRRTHLRLNMFFNVNVKVSIHCYFLFYSPFCGLCYSMLVSSLL